VQIRFENILYILWLNSQCSYVFDILLRNEKSVLFVMQKHVFNIIK